MPPPQDVGSRIWNGPNPCGLTDLDVAAGVVLGCDDEKRRDNSADGIAAPVDILQDDARRLLETGPCIVAFSGGRDSSALLAVFATVARRHGLRAPVAVTMRFDGDEASDERAWQEQVVRAVGIEHWEVVSANADLDLLGTEATGALSTTGLMWPSPAYALRPILRRARGGTVVSGEGGDEAFGLWPYARAWAMMRSGRRPPVREMGKLASAFTPLTLRRALWRWRVPPYQDWLAPAAYSAYADAQATELATDPVWWDDYLSLMRRRRGVTLGLDTMTRLAAAEGARFVAPFHNPTFLDALGRLGARWGMGGRTSIMTTLFGTLLAPAIVTRTTKATFGNVFWGPSSREFAHGWTGVGVDPALIDGDRLRAAWLAPTPVYGSALPLHAAWLATQAKAAP